MSESCTHARAALHRLLDLGDDHARIAIKDHAADCPGCRQLLDGWAVFETLADTAPSGRVPVFTIQGNRPHGFRSNITA